MGARQADAADTDGLAGAHVLGAGPGVVGGLGRDQRVAREQARSREVERDVGAGATVVDLGAAVEGQVHRLGCDAGGGGDAGIALGQPGVGQTVVAGVGTGKLVVGDGHRLAGAHVAVAAGAKAGPGVVAVVDVDVVVAVKGDRVAGHKVGGGGVGAHRGAAVIDFVAGGVAGRHVLGCDVDHHAATSAAGDAVVAGVGAGQVEARHRHGLGIAHILVGHLAGDAATARCGHAHHIARHHRCGVHGGTVDGDLHVACAVVNPVHGAHSAHRQGFGRNGAGGGGGGVLQRIVGGVSATDAQARGGDGPAGDHARTVVGHVLVGVAHAGGTHDDVVVEVPICRETDRCTVGAVVDAVGLAGAAQRQRQQVGRDVHADRASLGRVVGCIDATQTQARHGHGLAIAHVLVGHGAGQTRLAGLHLVTRDQPGQADGRGGQGNVAAGVVDAVGGIDAIDGERLGCDVHRHTAHAGQHVVAGVTSGDGHPIDGDCFARAHVLVEHGAAAHRRQVHADVVSCSRTGERGRRGRHGHGGGAVVGAVGGAEAAGCERGWRDVGRGGVAGGQHIVGSQAAGAVGQRVAAAQVDGFARAHSLGRKLRCKAAARCKGQAFSSHQAAKLRVAGHGGLQRAVVDLVGHQPVQRQCALANDEVGTAGQAQVVAVLHRVEVAGRQAVGAGIGCNTGDKDAVWVDHGRATHVDGRLPQAGGAVINLVDIGQRYRQGRQQAAQQRRGDAVVDAPDLRGATRGGQVPAGEGAGVLQVGQGAGRAAKAGRLAAGVSRPEAAGDRGTGVASSNQAAHHAGVPPGGADRARGVAARNGTIGLAHQAT